MARLLQVTSTAPPQASGIEPLLSASDPVSAAAPLRLDAISKRWRKDLPLVLDGLDLVLEPGTTTWVGGRNGSARRPCCRIAAGLIEPEAGRAEVWGSRHVGESRRATSSSCRSCPPVTAVCTRGSPCVVNSSSGHASR